MGSRTRGAEPRGAEPLVGITVALLRHINGYYSMVASSGGLYYSKLTSILKHKLYGSSRLYGFRD